MLATARTDRGRAVSKVLGLDAIHRYFSVFVSLDNSTFQTSRHVASTRTPSCPRLSGGEASDESDINTVKAQEGMAARLLKALPPGATEIRETVQEKDSTHSAAAEME